MSSNPDTRALPPGWITQYDPNYKTWFYVNTAAHPPVTTWEHPLGPLPPPPQSPPSYAPPANSPPPNNQYAYQGYQGYNSPPPQQTWGDPGYQQQQQWQQQPNEGGKGLLGGLFGKHNNNQQPQYGQPQYGQQPQVVYQQAPPKKSGGLGMGGGLALGAGAGLLGGVLLGEALEDNQHDAYEEGYNDGMDGDNFDY